MKELADEELVRRTAGGDAQAYRELSNRYLGRVFAFANRLCRTPEEAEEVTQETFLRLWQKAQTYKPRAKLITWLFRVARNLIIDRSRRRTDSLGPEFLEKAADSEHPARLLERKHVAQSVAAALASLPEPQRVAVVLSHYEGLSAEEAALVLDTSVRAFESRLARGRTQLRERLASLANDQEGSMDKPLAPNHAPPQTGVAR